MKVSELIEALGNLDPDATVVIARDEEGNGFHKFSDYDSAVATDLDEWEVNVIHPDDLPSYEGETLSPVVVFWP